MKRFFLMLFTLSGAIASAQSSFLDVYRFSNGRDYLFTWNYSEGVRARYGYEGVGFRLVRQYGPDTRPLYRCLRNDFPGHFISTKADCEGHHSEGVLGYAWGNPVARAYPLHRCSHPYTGMHLVTLEANECRYGGYDYEGVLGYAYR